MRYISLGQVLEIHRRVIDQSGGTPGVLNLVALESAVQQPRITFGGEDLYRTLAEKAAALAFSIIRNHPFIDGNKRTGHAAMEVSLILNG
jgi:death on curing protein